MEDSKELAPLAEAEAREAINRWSQGFFRIRYLGDKIFVRDIVPCFVYKVRLRTQYEERSVAPVSVAYHGEALDNRGTPPDAWSIEISRPDEFDDRTETLAIPHTDRVSLCPQCAGVGHIACGHCHGTGQTNCTQCGGRGFTDRLETRQQPNAQGQMTAHTVTVRDNCAHCVNGHVSCSSCHGNGRITCRTCEGTTRVRTFDQLTIRFRAANNYEVLDTTEVPDGRFERLKGEAIFSRRAPRIETPPGLPPAVEQCGRRLLQESQTTDERATRVLFQDLAIERVPVHEVKYMYAGVERRLWIYGDGRIHAPDAPWRRGRLIGILAAVAGAMLVAVLLFLAFGR